MSAERALRKAGIDVRNLEPKPSGAFVSDTLQRIRSGRQAMEETVLFVGMELRETLYTGFEIVQEVPGPKGHSTVIARTNVQGEKEFAFVHNKGIHCYEDLIGVAEEVQPDEWFKETVTQ